MSLGWPSKPSPMGEGSSSVSLPWMGWLKLSFGTICSSVPSWSCFSLERGCWQWVRGTRCVCLRFGWAQSLTLQITLGQARPLSRCQFPHLQVPFQPFLALTMGITLWSPSLTPSFIHEFLQWVVIEHLLYASGTAMPGRSQAWPCHLQLMLENPRSPH